MGDFSADWLALREPADARSRCSIVLAALAKAFRDRPAVRVTDIGCGTGASLRAVAPWLGSRQHWTLIDHDPALLDAAADALRGWATSASTERGGLVLSKDGQTITARLRNADLRGEIEAVLDEDADLVTASALFDLVSPAFILRVARAVAARGTALYACLTFDGRQHWHPAHPADAMVRDAFNLHQGTDKGFGPAAGPDAPALLARALVSAGFRVSSGDSPWLLDAGDETLMAQLVSGIADAAEATGRITAAAAQQWRAVPRTRCFVGHTDLLALPPA